MRVYLDDERPTPSGWIRAYTPEQAIGLLTLGCVTEISLDHDLGLPDPRNGYMVVLWLEEQVLCHGFKPPTIRIHSANTSAADKMRSAVRRIERG